MTSNRRLFVVAGFNEAMVRLAEHLRRLEGAVSARQAEALTHAAQNATAVWHSGRTACRRLAAEYPLARESLLHLTDRPSATRSRALRHLGAALVRLGRTAEGVEVLDLAISAGVQSDRPVVAANPLYQRGQHARDQGDLVGAERRFRAALALLKDGAGRRNVRRKVHRGLAITLARQGQPEAAYHAREAVASHKDPASEEAALERQLLAELTGINDAN